VSYPRQIQPLVIEDELVVKASYEQLFIDLGKKGFSVLPPRFAFCYEDALAEIRSNCIFHLVILDLCLPERSGIAVDDSSVGWGMSLCDELALRDAYPVPAVVIRTAFASKTEQSELRSRLDRDFAYGELVVKGGGFSGELEKAVQKVLKYLDAGIHVSDGRDRRWPTLSPREEDLLRRMILSKQGAIGLDLRWWTAEHLRPTGQFAAFRGWTKTLMGQFLLDKGRGSSSLNFFKLAPAAEASVVEQDARLLEQKLNHVKVSAVLVGQSRFLLVTEKTGGGGQPPVPLDEFLSSPLATSIPAIKGIASQIVIQLDSLGEKGFQMRRASELLWRGRGEGHDESGLESALSNFGQYREKSSLRHLRADPLALLRDIRGSERQIRYDERSCTHGDLNITNVALDVRGGSVNAYIFDASGTGRGPMAWDVAMLEVSALLHLPEDFSESLVQTCGEILYGRAISIPDSVLASFRGSDRAVATVHMIRELREQVLIAGMGEVYALAVFDQMLIQLGGLKYPSGNKVSRFDDVPLLADMVSHWFRIVSDGVLGGGV
jgi:CheY-like chemotaxis protein